jgi:RNA polymerase sigma-70 factor (ECF subfamily)
MSCSPRTLIHKIKSGDQEAFADLIKRYYTGLCAYSCRYVGRYDLAEDIVSETFHKIWQKREELNIHYSIKSYLFQAVTNNSLMYLRNVKQEENLEDFHLELESKSSAGAAGSLYVADQEVLIQELSQKIEAVINKLPPQQQTAFRYKRFEGKKNREIAEEMGIAVKTVEMHLAKAMLFMRSNFKEYLPLALLILGWK